jgi:hypothetical protein
MKSEPVITQLVNHLPLDIKEVIYQMYKNRFEMQTLLKKPPVNFAMHLTRTSSPSHDGFDDDMAGNRDFEFNTSISCDNSNLVWAHFTICYSRWCGWCYNLHNVPLMHIPNDWNTKTITKLVKLWKQVFAEYVHYNHQCGTKSFYKRSKQEFELGFWDWERQPCDSLPIQENETKRMPYLRCKDLVKLIRQRWYNDEMLDVLQTSPELQETIKSYTRDAYGFPDICSKSLGRFRMDDAIPDMGSFYVRVPYSPVGLKCIKDDLPVVFSLLEHHGQLHSPKLEFTEPMKEYMELSKMIKEAEANYIEKHGCKPGRNHSFQGYDNMPPAAEFNERVENIIRNRFGWNWHSASYDYYTGYVDIMDVHELIGDELAVISDGVFHPVIGTDMFN